MIRKFILLTIVLSSVFSKITAQDYLGLSTGNYGGIQGVMLQPASAADNRYQFEVNLLSGSLNFSNNYVGISRDYFFKNKLSLSGFESYQDFRTKVLTKDNSINEKVYMNIANRINLPSLLLSTGVNSGIALNFQSRTGLALRNLNVGLANQIYSTWDDNSTYGQTYDAGGVDVSGMNWLEFGLTYGRVLINENEHFLKAGVTAKYLGGISSMYFNADELFVRADNDSILYVQSDQINYGHSATNISGGINSSFRPDASTFGFDLGLVYEFRGRIDNFKFLKYDENNRLRIARRRDKNKYTFKVGVSLLDVGKFKFQSVPRARNFSIDDEINLNAISVRSINDFDDEVQRRGNYVSDSSEKYSVALPTAFSAQVDVHLYKGFYLNAMIYKPVSAFNYNADVRIYTPDYYAVTPRWESRVAGVYLPFVLNSKKEISAGATIRVGPIFVGTSNLLSFIEKDNIKAADVHAGLKIPIAFRKPGTPNGLLKKIIADDDDDEIDVKLPNDSLFLKDTTTKVVVQPDTTAKMMNKKPVAPLPPTQQPINIIINNYNSPNSAVPSSSQIYRLDSTNNLVPVNNVQKSLPAPVQPPASEANELNKLQEQINDLNRKLDEKEDLLRQLKEDQKALKDSSSNMDIKKKSDSLTVKYTEAGIMPETSGNLNGDTSYNKTIYKQKVSELTAMLDVLNARNDLLDKQLEYNVLENKQQKDQMRAGHFKDTQSVNVTMNNGANIPYKDTAKVQDKPKIQDLQQYKTDAPGDKEYALRDTINRQTKPAGRPAALNTASSEKEGKMDSTAYYYGKYLQLQEENKELRDKIDNTATTASRPEPNATPAGSPTIMSGNPSFPDSLARRTDVNKLTQEIEQLKREVANGNNSNNKPQEIVVKQTPSLVPNIMPTVGIGLGGNKTKVVHDTVYLKSPVSDTIVRYATDTVVKTIRDTVIQVDTVVQKIQDTISNIIVKDSLITKIKVIDSLKSNLLSMPPTVILFDLGKYNLKMAYKRQLDYYAAQAIKVPELVIAITGHTDKTGSAAQNLILSKKRAAAVTGYLVSKGVDNKRIIETALGEDEPIANNETVTGQSQNRRVEIVFEEAGQ